MKAALCFFIPWWNLCCSPLPAAPAVHPDKTVLVVIQMPAPTWQQSASATVAPLIVPITTALKLVLP